MGGRTLSMEASSDLEVEAILAMQGKYRPGQAATVIADFLRSDEPISRSFRDRLVLLLEPMNLTDPRLELHGLEEGVRIQKLMTKCDNLKLGNKVLVLIDEGLGSSDAQRKVAEDETAAFNTVRTAHSYAKKFRAHCDAFKGNQDSKNLSYHSWRLKFFHDDL